MYKWCTILVYNSRFHYILCSVLWVAKRVLRMKYHVTHYHRFQGWRANCDKYSWLNFVCWQKALTHISPRYVCTYELLLQIFHTMYGIISIQYTRGFAVHFMLYCACQRGSNLLLWALGMRTHANGSVSIWALLCVQATCPPPRQQNKVFPICPTSFDFNNHPSFARESSTSVHVDLASFKAVCFHTGASERYSPTALLEKWQCHWAVSI